MNEVKRNELLLKLFLVKIRVTASLLGYAVSDLDMIFTVV